MINLAIVIPFYKLDFFEDALKSLSLQTNKRFNVYIGDDHSPHNVHPLIEQYQTSLNISYVRFEDNLGGKNLVKQWTRCMGLMQKEEWFMLLGDDDYLGPTVVEDFYATLATTSQQPIELIRLNRVQVNEQGYVIGEDFAYAETFQATEIFINKYQHSILSTMSEFIFKTETYRQYGFYEFPLAWYTDDCAILQLSNFGTTRYLKSAICYVRKSELNISSLSSNLLEKQKAAQMFYQFLANNLNRYPEDQKPLILRIIFDYEKGAFAWIQLPNKRKMYEKYFGLKTIWAFLKYQYATKTKGRYYKWKDGMIKKWRKV